MLRTASIKDEAWSARVEIDTTAAFDVVLSAVLRVTMWGQERTTLSLRCHAQLDPGIPFYLWDAGFEDGIDLEKIKLESVANKSMDTHFIDIMRLPHEHDAQALVAQLQQKVFALCGVTFDHPPKGKPFEYYNVTLCNAVGSEYAGAKLFAQDANAAAFLPYYHAPN